MKDLFFGLNETIANTLHHRSVAVTRTSWSPRCEEGDRRRLLVTICDWYNQGRWGTLGKVADKLSERKQTPRKWIADPAGFQPNSIDTTLHRNKSESLSPRERSIRSSHLELSNTLLSNSLVVTVQSLHIKSKQLLMPWLTPTKTVPEKKVFAFSEQNAWSGENELTYTLAEPSNRLTQTCGGNHGVVCDY